MVILACISKIGVTTLFVMSNYSIVSEHKDMTLSSYIK